ncbi:beta-propeller domain-containing protein [Mesobacillus zeae]|uniref:SbsA Ig-like domain-containing protein n=1 Tax=Mesobacillus zeae TaxID=1917180 RepID=A0A398BJB2_9BACI|nr:beta-propeller domain-containing protein [Mesobacillus zeae]RID87473.1 hypothetical protein D1970_04670 [Mesobacillus zeae]
MKYWRLWTAVLLLILAGIIFLSATQVKITNKLDDKTVVLTNKVWKVQFSQKISAKSLKPNKIYVMNDKGETQENKLSLSDDKKTVYIYPPKSGYDTSSKSYTIHFKKGIRSVSGRRLVSAMKQTFTVQKELPVVGSRQKLADYFDTILEEENTSGGFFTTTRESKSMISDDSEKKEFSSAEGDFSETNVQVEGVDEADIVKTDGTHIFQAEQNKVRIIKAVPEDKMKLLATISYDHNFTPYQLFLHKKQLIVIGSKYRDWSSKEEAAIIAPMSQAAKVIVYNVENPEKPEVMREAELEGSYASSRKADGFLYMTAEHRPDYWIMKEKRNIDFRPGYSDTAVKPVKQKVDYDKIQFFPESREPDFTMIMALDLNDLSKKAGVTTYLGSGGQMYMSNNHLYLAVSKYGEQPLEDRQMIAPDTDIHKFSIDGMEVIFKGSAEVQGTVLNQFSMDEHDGHFRVVTTKGHAWDEKGNSANQLYILDEGLNLAGKLEGLAKGERIYSARFLGDRIYMVTFKETDPLFAIDASEPSNPKVLGELKIPGFSNYLHPYDENHLIGFGQDTKVIDGKGKEEPQIISGGVKISLFDVSDMTNPKEKFTETIGEAGTNSPLNNDHRALLFNKNKNLFAFPVAVYTNKKGGEQMEQTFEYQGANVYGIDPDKGFELRSKITHIDGKQKPVYEEYESSINRLLYIDDTLYALSPEKITSHSLKTYNKKGELKLH